MENEKKAIKEISKIKGLKHDIIRSAKSDEQYEQILQKY